MESKSGLIYVCVFVKCLVIGPRAYIMRTNPQDNAQHMFYKALHMFCRSTDMERHRQNATEELRDRRRQGDRDRRIGR